MFDNLVKTSEAVNYENPYPPRSGPNRRFEQRREQRVPAKTGLGRFLGAGAVGAGVGAVGSLGMLGKRVGDSKAYAYSKVNPLRYKEYMRRIGGPLTKGVGKGIAIGGAAGLGIGGLLMALKRMAARKQLSQGAPGQY